jgi:hypothetical protein
MSPSLASILPPLCPLAVTVAAMAFLLPQKLATPPYRTLHMRDREGYGHLHVASNPGSLWLQASRFHRTVLLTVAAALRARRGNIAPLDRSSFLVYCSPDVHTNDT